VWEVGVGQGKARSKRGVVTEKEEPEAVREVKIVREADTGPAGWLQAAQLHLNSTAAPAAHGPRAGTRRRLSMQGDVLQGGWGPPAPLQVGVGGPRCRRIRT
jgi:hypothetical protein